MPLRDGFPADQIWRVPTAGSDGAASAIRPKALTAMDLNLHTPYTMQYSLSVRRPISSVIPGLKSLRVLPA